MVVVIVDLLKPLFTWGYYVIAFLPGSRYANKNEKDTDYTTSPCGAFWLSVELENDIAHGDIGEKSGRITLKALKSKIRKLPQTAAVMQ